MKKSTKTLWIYIAVLFAIAILLILVTTFTQSKIVDDNGDLSVMGTLTATSKQKIINLQNENVALATELANLQKEHAALVEASAEVAEQAEAEKEVQAKVAKLYQAYVDEDYSLMAKLMDELTQEQIEQRIPTLYKRVKRVIE